MTLTKKTIEDYIKDFTKKTLAFHHHLRILKTRPWQYGKSFVTRPISKLNSKIQSLDLKLKKN